MREALKLALEALEESHPEAYRHVITAIKEALVQEKALQALHDENERLGLYKDAYAKPEEEKLHPVHIGVDVTREGTAVTAFYRKPNAVMEMFYSQFHPLSQPEQEPVAWWIPKAEQFCLPSSDGTRPFAKAWEPLYTTPPQRTWVGLTDEEKQEWIDAMPYDPQPRHCMILVNIIEAKLKEQNNA
jgi:hypothetical protein